MILEPFERISSEYLAVFFNHSVSLIVSFSVPLTLSVFSFFLPFSLPLFLLLCHIRCLCFCFFDTFTVSVSASLSLSLFLLLSNCLPLPLSLTPPLTLLSLILSLSLCLSLLSLSLLSYLILSSSFYNQIDPVRDLVYVKGAVPGNPGEHCTRWQNQNT